MATASAVNADVAKAGVRRVLWITLILNVVVSGSKIAVGKLTGSLSMVADGYHSLMDGSNNVIGLVVTTFAYAPPDEGHPYGHRKFETAATLFIGLALLGLAYNVVENALSAPAVAPASEIGVINWVVMGATWASTSSWPPTRRAGAQARQRLPHRRRRPHAVGHLRDARVIASFAGGKAGVPWMDSVVAIGIAAFISILAVRIMVGSFHTLTDRAMIPGHALQGRDGRARVQHCREIRTRGGRARSTST
jgi:cation diffusion facilitator family transporter